MADGLEAHAGRVCVVTGGGSGIGRGIVNFLASRGATVIVADRDAGRAELVSERVRNAGGTAHAATVNVADEDSVAAFTQGLQDSLGRVDVLVNNAGIDLREGDVTEMPRRAWDLTIAVNLTGPFLMARHIVPLMPPGSAIVNIGSLAGVNAIPGCDAYVAAKGGIIALTKALALSLADRGIRANVVNPGIVGTDEVLSHIDEPRMLAAIERTRPLRSSFAEPAELAAVVAFLSSPEASYVNGTVVNVDGGATC